MGGCSCKRTGCVKTKAGNPPILYIFISGVTFGGETAYSESKESKKRSLMKLSVLFKRIQHAVIQMPELEEEMEIRGLPVIPKRQKKTVCLSAFREAGQMDMII